MNGKTTSWRNDGGEWKRRYSQLYSIQGYKSVSDKTARERYISFMSNDSEPQALAKSLDSNKPSAETLSVMSIQPNILISNTYCSSHRAMDDLGEHGTKLLNMVRERSRLSQDVILDHPLDIPKEDSEDECDLQRDNLMMESVMPGWSTRGREHSMSRSRISRVSTKRDIDIPSLMAYTANLQEQDNVPKVIQNMDFQKAKPQEADLPRWSIRRAVCPVCSQKWRDRSSVSNVKNSGLKRNFSSEFTSVIAPARLRTSITMGYAPRPTLTVVNEECGALRTTGPSWQFTRARKFRCPKPILPPPEATAPPSATAPQARKGLDTRLHKFLSNLQEVNDNTDTKFPSMFELTSNL